MGEKLNSFYFLINFSHISSYREVYANRTPVPLRYQTNQATAFALYPQNHAHHHQHLHQFIYNKPDHKQITKTTP